MTVSSETRRQRRELAAYEYAWCRTFGHAWQEWHTDREPDFGWYESVQCPRCTTERLFTVSSLGTVIGRRYIYPEGYRLGFKVNAADLRRAMRRAGWFDPAARAVSAKVNTRSRRVAS